MIDLTLYALTQVSSSTTTIAHYLNPKYIVSDLLSIRYNTFYIGLDKNVFFGFKFNKYYNARFILNSNYWYSYFHDKPSTIYSDHKIILSNLELMTLFFIPEETLALYTILIPDFPSIPDVKRKLNVNRS